MHRTADKGSIQQLCSEIQKEKSEVASSKANKPHKPCTDFPCSASLSCSAQEFVDAEQGPVGKIRRTSIYVTESFLKMSRFVLVFGTLFVEE